MTSIGIIANPSSGKDIRRLVSYATTIGNLEKVNIAKRIVLAAQSMGVDTVWFMPDTFQIGWNVMTDLSDDGKLTANCQILDIPLTGTPADTVRAAQEMERLHVGCCVVLGGDGTSRAVAKVIQYMPLLPVSTGTNNVYPAMIEGTVAGMAAAAAAQLADPEICCLRDKRIEISINGAFSDIALIDATISSDLWVGSKAIWETEKLRQLYVTRCHPATIGFSSIAGCIDVILDTEDRGMEVVLGDGGNPLLAPVAAGVLAPLTVTSAKWIALDEPQETTVDENCMIALDGERELRVHKGDTLSVAITRNGPWRVQIQKTLEEAVHRGLFNSSWSKEMLGR